MSTQRIFVVALVMVLLLTGCGETQEQPPIQPDPTPVPTSTPIPEPDVTVCASGCDFTLIQEAIKAESTDAGTVIGVLDPVHTEGGILVSKDVVIQGSGAEKTIVQAHATSGEGTQRVFEIPSDASVTIRGMTVRHGNPQTSPLTGGGILNYGALMLENAIVRDNFGSAGGGIYDEGTLTLLNSSVSHNNSVGGGDAYLECSTGGGLKVLSGTATLINSTVSDNHSNDKGGGIHVACHGKLILQNSTISGNFATTSGGGVYLNGSGAFTNSTISNNSANNVGGIALNGSGDETQEHGHLSLFNSLIADNIARLGDYGITDCNMEDYAEIVVTSYSWIADGHCEPAFSGDPLLGPLTDNGGSTLTHSLLPGSPAIDAIPAEACSLESDQRGEPRLAPCDIGAFEAQAP